MRCCFHFVCRKVAHLVLGLSSIILWQIGGSLWKKKGLYARYCLSGCLFSWLWLCTRLARLSDRSRAPFTHNVITDGVTLAVLRGFQGVGGAATIPSAVSSSEILFMEKYSLTFSARYPSACIPTIKSTFDSIRYLCSGCSCRWRVWHAHRRCPDSTHVVRHH